MIAVVPATSTLVDQGPRVQSILASYPQQVRVLQTVDPATLATLKANPNNPPAAARAISELSALPASTVVRVLALSTTFKAQLATLAAVDPATLATLSRQPTNPAAQAKAVGEIATKFGVPPAQAITRLKAAGRVPRADIGFLTANGPRVQRAAAQLQSVSKIPPSDLAYLQANGAKVGKAQKDNPGQWQTWWWICLAAQIVFVPFVFLLTGYWNPRKARAVEREHERMVERELARLHADRAAAS
jgi:hypothetical protein